MTSIRVTIDGKFVDFNGRKKKLPLNLYVGSFDYQPDDELTKTDSAVQIGESLIRAIDLARDSDDVKLNNVDRIELTVQWEEVKTFLVTETVNYTVAAKSADEAAEIYRDKGSEAATFEGVVSRQVTEAE